jgi:hypothetical protein
MRFGRAIDLIAAMARRVGRGGTYRLALPRVAPLTLYRLESGLTGAGESFLCASVRSGQGCARRQDGPLGRLGKGVP